MQRILVIQTAFIGDVILATALLEKLHQTYPTAEIDFLVRKGNESLVKDHPWLHAVLVLNKKEKWKSLRQLLRHIRRRRYDVVVNVQRFFASGLLTALSGAPQRIGFRKNPMGLFFTHRLPHEIGTGTHEVERNLQLIAHLVPPGFQSPRLYPPPGNAAELMKSKPYVCIAPTSVWFTKQWPAERWVALMDALPAATTVYLLGGPADRTACAAIRDASTHPRVLNTAGELSLLQSAALMRGAIMNYANDSAPIHLASATDAPMTAVFCSTVPAFGFTPLSQNSKVVETEEDLDCRPCGLHGYRACPEGHFRCAAIAVDRVI